MLLKRQLNDCWIEPDARHPKYSLIAIPVGQYGIMRLGIRKAQAVLQYISDIEEFVQSEREARDSKNSVRETRSDDPGVEADNKVNDEDTKNKIMRLTKTQCEYNDSFQKGWRDNLQKDGWMLIVISDKEN